MPANSATVYVRGLYARRTDIPGNTYIDFDLTVLAGVIVSNWPRS